MQNVSTPLPIYAACALLHKLLVVDKSIGFERCVLGFVFSFVCVSGRSTLVNKDSWLEKSTGQYFFSVPFDQSNIINEVYLGGITSAVINTAVEPNRIFFVSRCPWWS